MSNSSLVSVTKISPNKTSPRNHAIDTITIHCYVGQVSVESGLNYLAQPGTKASANYVIGKDGRIGLGVDEKDRSWCTSSASNDHRAITIECASDTTSPYAINDAVYASLIKLCADICKRNGIKELKWKGDKSLIGNVSKQNMTVHRWFANKACPGDYIYSRLGQIADEVNAILNPPVVEEDTKTMYRVRKSWNDAKTQVGAYKVLENAKKAADKNPGYNVYDEKGKKVYPEDAPAKAETETVMADLYRVDIPNLNIRKGPSTDDPATGKFTGVGTFTIVEIQNGKGSKSGWGLLKSYKSGRDGWISLDFAKKV